MKPVPSNLPNSVSKWWAGVFAAQHKRASSVNVIIEDSGGRLLIVKSQYKPYWSMPGGWIDKGDSPRQAAVREVKEEVGLSLEAASLELASVVNRWSTMAETHLFVFRLIDPIDSSAKLTIQSDELVDYDWVRRGEVLEEKHGDYNVAVKNWASDSPETYIEEKF